MTYDKLVEIATVKLFDMYIKNPDERYQIYNLAVAADYFARTYMERVNAIESARSRHD